ncbi:nucleoside monophosphate kinase [Kitasatospora sp. NPDC004289]
MRILLFAPPFWERDTPAHLLARSLGIPGINLGDVVRSHLHRGTPTGVRIQERIDGGHLVPDGLVAEAVREHLTDTSPTAFLLTGHPRTPEQAVALDQDLQSLGTPLDAVLLVRPTPPTVDRFVRHRAARSPGEHPEETLRKLEHLASTVEPLAHHYAAQGILRTVDALPSPEATAAEALTALHSL